THTTIVMGGEQHACVAWMRRKREHMSAEFCDGAHRVSDGAQVGEQRLGAFQSARIGGLQPAECLEVVHAARFECKNYLREIQAFHFREFLSRTRRLLMGGP